MTSNNKRTTAELFEDDDLIEQALGEAVEEALRDHKRAGNPVCEWRDGKVVWIPPEEIPVDA
ncbi:hypothetical protein B7486_12355 [cyanobacterium TDX16]|nr:hypothetical protein B7486_12355 [cyanobacterium TDX16]